jgi:hypothetical protein
MGRIAAAVMIDVQFTGTGRRMDIGTNRCDDVCARNGRIHHFSTAGMTMAQKVHIVLEDDIDGSAADETVSFALDGTTYEIDLSTANADTMRSALATYVGHARKVGGRGRPAKRSAAASTGGASAAEVRAWAKSNGYTVPDRGRIPSEVRAAYDAAS